MAGGRMPDYRLSALNKATGEKRSIGAAWINESGNLSVKLDPFTVLTASPDLVLTLFPANERDRQQMTQTDPPAKQAAAKPQRTFRAKPNSKRLPAEEQPDIPF